MLSNIGHNLRLHCGTIVCAPGMSGQDTADHLGLSGGASREDLGDDTIPSHLKGNNSFPQNEVDARKTKQSRHHHTVHVCGACP